MGVDPNDPSGGAGFSGAGMNIDPTEIFKMFFGGDGGMGGMGGMGSMGGFDGARVFKMGAGGPGMQFFTTNANGGGGDDFGAGFPGFAF